MVSKYSKKWFEIYQIINKAQKEVYEHVEEICLMVKKDIEEFLEGLRRSLSFTYSVEPWIGDGDMSRCIPCLYVEADEEVFRIVESRVKETFRELMSESRLRIEKKPMQPRIE
jgi:hypothetical protein